MAWRNSSISFDNSTTHIHDIPPHVTQAADQQRRGARWRNLRKQLPSWGIAVLLGVAGALFFPVRFEGEVVLMFPLDALAVFLAMNLLVTMIALTLIRCGFERAWVGGGAALVLLVWTVYAFQLN